MSLSATHRKILDAAAVRFRHYGYAKTTMGELARDCKMSPGNIYRYFKSKMDIAETMTHEQGVRAIEDLRTLLDCPSRSARQCLVDFLFADLRNTFHMLEHKPHVVEMVHIVTRARPKVHAEMMERERDSLTKILQMGIASSEFTITDTEKCAQALQLALLKFRFPQVFTQQTLDELETELSYLLGFLLIGLTQGVAPAFAPVEPTPEVPATPPAPSSPARLQIVGT